jgi:hypothetical protein
MSKNKEKKKEKETEEIKDVRPSKAKEKEEDEENESVEDKEEEEKEEDKEDVEKKEKHHLTNVQIRKELKAIRKDLTVIKKKVNAPKNRKYFEVSARDPSTYTPLIETVDAIKEIHDSLVQAKKRQAQARYTKPAVLLFMNENPLSDDQPKLPKLASGKGLATKQVMGAYIYGYLRVYECEKKGPHTYILDDKLKALIKELLNEDMEEWTFKIAQTVITRTMFSSIEPLQEHVDKYQEAGVFDFFANLNK